MTNFDVSKRRKDLDGLGWASPTLSIVTYRHYGNQYSLRPWTTDVVLQNGSLLWRTEHASEASALWAHDDLVKRSMPHDDPDAPIQDSPILKVFDPTLTEPQKD